MTDNEIIKALECCGISECNNCPYCGDDLLRECNQNLCGDAAKLIYRQKSKIEALQMDYNQLQSDNINANQNLDHITNLWEVEKEKVEKAKQKVIKVCKELQTAKAEIESLKIANEKMYQACKEQEAEQERECPTCYGTGKLHTSDWLVKGITKEQLAKEKEEVIQEGIDFFRKEAIKEFAERVHDRLATEVQVEYEISNGFIKDAYNINDTHIVINNLVKEMTEEK